MFEDFSFSSPSSNGPLCLALDADDRVMADCDSSMISPLSSRCPSPPSFHRVSRPLSRTPSRTRSSLFRPQPPTSNPYEYKRRLSIGTLTQKLHAHTLTSGYSEEHNEEAPVSPVSPHSAPEVVPAPARYAGYILTPPDTDHDDEGYDESSSLTSPSQTSPQSPFLSPTSVPYDYLPLDTSSEFSSEIERSVSEEQLSVRLQRQRISRLQCNAMTGLDAIRLALLSEDEKADLEALREDDCHPSSLPPQLSPGRRTSTVNRSRFRQNSIVNGVCDRSVTDPKVRRKSSSGAMSSHRIDKGHYPISGRELRKKSEQELRRKSIVCAALASITTNSQNSGSSAQ